MKFYKIIIKYNENDIESVIAKNIHIENGKIYIQEVCNNDFWIYFEELVDIQQIENY